MCASFAAGGAIAGSEEMLVCALGCGRCARRSRSCASLRGDGPRSRVPGCATWRAGSGEAERVLRGGRSACGQRQDAGAGRRAAVAIVRTRSRFCAISSVHRRGDSGGSCARRRMRRSGPISCARMGDFATRREIAAIVWMGRLDAIPRRGARRRDAHACLLSVARPDTPDLPRCARCIKHLGYAPRALDPVAWEEEHAANPPAAKKRKSKSKAKKKGEDGDEEDELAADDAAEEEPEEEAEEDEEKEKAGKKRKRASSPAPAKSKAKAPKAAKAKKGGKAKKSKAAVESEDDAGEEAEAEGEEGGEDGEARASKKAKVVDGSAAQLESDPEALKVREWRHKLQKTFLSSNKSVPKEEEMPQVDLLFTTVEGYHDMSIEYLTFSKIGKVMRHIHLLEPDRVPRDDEFKFRDRAKALVDKWHGILNANKATDGESAAVTESTARMDLNGTGEGEGEGDLTVMDITMNGDEAKMHKTYCLTSPAPTVYRPHDLRNVSTFICTPIFARPRKYSGVFGSAWRRVAVTTHTAPNASDFVLHFCSVSLDHLPTQLDLLLRYLPRPVSSSRMSISGPYLFGEIIGLESFSLAFEVSLGGFRGLEGLRECYSRILPLTRVRITFCSSNFPPNGVQKTCLRISRSLLLRLPSAEPDTSSLLFDSKLQTFTHHCVSDPGAASNRTAIAAACVSMLASLPGQHPRSATAHVLQVPESAFFRIVTSSVPQVSSILRRTRHDAVTSCKGL
ncbi:hypothetical protein C8R47DRAFT_1082303 [Mycena vitilis]|nr:hypothetical protein C8R47DRAFT_1082303 [Mycena vitilis]